MLSAPPTGDFRLSF